MSKVFIVRFHVIQFTRYSVVHSRSLGVRRELLYIITTLFVCQELFSNSFKLFQVVVALPATPFITQLLYHSRTFIICQELFSSFFKFLSFPPCFAVCFLTTCIYYHLILNLSSTFLKNFLILNFCLSSFIFDRTSRFMCPPLAYIIRMPVFASGYANSPGTFVPGPVPTILYISMRSLLRYSSSALRWGYGPAPWCHGRGR